ncbi:hypothetical protein D3C80_2188420 [compost metagenome]
MGNKLLLLLAPEEEEAAAAAAAVPDAFEVFFFFDLEAPDGVGEPLVEEAEADVDMVEDDEAPVDLFLPFCVLSNLA